MATSTFDPARDTLRWFTRARRIPRLVGKLPGMERGLPFGPYTMTQAVGASATGVVLLKTEPVWGHFGWLSNKVVMIVVTVAVTVFLRLVKPGGRDPLSALFALLRVGMASRHGTLRGRDLRARKPVHVRARVRVSWPAIAAAGLPVELAAPIQVGEAAGASAAAGVAEEADLSELLGLQPAPRAAGAPPSTTGRPPVRPVPSLGGSLPPRTALERLLVSAQVQEV